MMRRPQAGVLGRVGQGGGRMCQVDNAGKGILGQENSFCKERLKEESLGWVCRDWEIPHLRSHGKVWSMASSVLEGSLVAVCQARGQEGEGAERKRLDGDQSVEDGRSCNRALLGTAVLKMTTRGRCEPASRGGCCWWQDIPQHNCACWLCLLTCSQLCTDLCTPFMFLSACLCVGSTQE